ncbi:hypothetical protein Leryth_011246 [Lithospermum erythrorhizon]|nr:hypothetical protein Leryth_011246 [Lithospermum erythrorhizon]
MATHNINLAVIIKNVSDQNNILLLKLTPPPKFNHPEYDSFQDSDLWDLLSTPLTPSQTHSSSSLNSNHFILGIESCSEIVDLTQFDLHLALDQVLGHLGYEKGSNEEWKFSKCIEEPGFGPGLPVKTVFVEALLRYTDGNLTDFCKWISVGHCLDFLTQSKLTNGRVGPLVVLGVLNDLMQSEGLKMPSTLLYQEFPPGVKIVPMGSRTTRPFSTTNLVVFAPDTHGTLSDDAFINGDALIVDPGCKSSFHSELKEIVAALPRKLVVFVTHHHPDHVDGLSIIQKYCPEATLLGHENTMRRIHKDDWSLGYVSVSGTEEICISGQRLRIISAPGHTDGHMALLHVNTNALIVGDHCVGQGSALLDITSGGNMNDYFQTTYKFLEMSPHVLIPMHGRVNLWPKHMLCGYLKNRRSREAAILKAIEGGAKTLFDIVAYTYSDVDKGLWIPAASNVRLHVDYLAQQDKLPEEFSVQRFQSSCGTWFLSRWLLAYANGVFPRHINMAKAMLCGTITVAGFAVLYNLRSKQNRH